MVRHHAEGEEDSSIQGRMSAKQSYKKAQRVVPLPKPAKRATPPSRILQEAKKRIWKLFF